MSDKLYILTDCDEGHLEDFIGDKSMLDHGGQPATTDRERAVEWLRNHRHRGGIYVEYYGTWDAHVIPHVNAVSADLSGPDCLNIWKMNMATTDSGETADVLREKAPLSVESLFDAEIVQALWERTADRSDVEQSAYGVWLLLTDGYDASGNVKLFQVETALDAHGIADFYETSLGFKNRIHQEN